MRPGTPLGILLGGVIGGVADWIFGLSGFAVVTGLAAGGLLGHLMWPSDARAMRARADGGGDSGGGSLFDVGMTSSVSGGDGGGSDNCDTASDGGSDSGSCDSGGGDGGGGGD